MNQIIALLILSFSSLHAVATQIEPDQAIADESAACRVNDDCRLFIAPCDFKDAARTVLVDPGVPPSALKDRPALNTYEDFLLDETQLYLNQGFCLNEPRKMTDSRCAFKFYRDRSKCVWLGM